MICCIYKYHLILFGTKTIKTGSYTGSAVRIVMFSPLGRYVLLSSGQRVGLEGELCFTFHGRGCAGAFVDGKYVHCDSNSAPYCERCELIDYCTICRGECLKIQKDCLQEHTVYLAFFAPDIVKVGVTRSNRLNDRLREQGADRGAVLATFPDGERARQEEQYISQNIPSIVSTESKLAGLNRKPNLRLWQKVIKSFGVSSDIALDYFTEPLWMSPLPLKAHTGTTITGEVVGLKGPVMVLEKFNTLYAINCHSLLGYDVSFVPGPFNLQASLRAFSIEV